MASKSENKPKVNIIIYSEDGILDTPLVIDNEEKAKENFITMATLVLGPDIKKVDFDSDDFMDKVNELLKYQGKEIIWFTDIEVA